MHHEVPGKQARVAAIRAVYIVTLFSFRVMTEFCPAKVIHRLQKNQAMIRQIDSGKSQKVFQDSAFAIRGTESYCPCNKFVSVFREPDG